MSTIRSRYFINALQLWIMRRITWRTLRYALRERPIAVAGKGGSYHVHPHDLYENEQGNDHE